MLVLKHATKKYGKTDAITDVSLRVDPKEFVCILGPAGSGKTTLLHLLAGLDAPTKGSVEIDGVDLRQVPETGMRLLRQRTGIVYQDGRLQEHATVEENVALPLEALGLPDSVIRKRVPALLKLFGLETKARFFPNQLSAGEKAKTAIARAFAGKPLILILDEPTALLDRTETESVMALLRDLSIAGTTIILATHDASIAALLPARVVSIEHGRIAADKIVREEKKTEPAKQQPHRVFQHEPAGQEEEELLVRRVRSSTVKEASRKIHITSIGPS
jgi:cell division transport system ATP-binding protein